MPIRTLKVVVVVMGVMILVGFAALLAIIAGRLSRGGAVSVPAAGSAAAVAPAAVALPAGARIETIGVGADRLVLALLLADGSRELLVVDAASGRRLATIPLRTAP